MNDFKGLSRVTGLAKTPSEMWHLARNIILSRQYLSVSNEQGSEFMYNIPGVYLGAIVSNDDIVYFSKDGSYSCIGYCNSRDNIYRPVLRTNNPNFTFDISCPIEGIYIYNYKKELIVVFSNGINTTSLTPKLMNLTKPQARLTADKEFLTPDEWVIFELFNHNNLPLVEYEYQTGSLDAEIVHLAVSYIFEDNTDSLYSPILETVYPNFKGYNTVKRNVKFTLTNLSPLYTKIKLAFIIKKEAGVFAYDTAILPIENGKVIYTLSSEEDLGILTPDEIVIPTERFTKIRTITKTANQIEIGNVEKRDNFQFQMYANRLKLGLKLLYTEGDLEKYKSNPTFLPDEVYNISIVPIALDGTRLNAFHIPGREGTVDEKKVMTDADLAYYGLSFPKYKDKGYKIFHLKNTGLAADPNNCSFAYWENEDLYPNKDYYNSTSVGGADLRNTPIRFHRFPSIDNITVPTLGIYTTRITGEVDDKIGYVPRFAIDVTNFDSVVPPSIKDQLQGYEIVFEKRTRGGTYIETMGMLYKFIIKSRSNHDYLIYGEQEAPDDKGKVVSDQRYDDFSISNFISVEVVKDKIDINADIVKVYTPLMHRYPINDKNYINWNDGRAGTVDVPVLNPQYERVGNITNAKYLLANNISSNNRFREESLQLTVEHLRTASDIRAFIPITKGNAVLNILSASLITLNKNIYNLENNNDYISVGIVLFKGTAKKLVNGDVFTNNIIKKSFSAVYAETLSNSGKEVAIRAFANFFLYNLYSPLSNHYIVNGAAVTKRTNIHRAIGEFSHVDIYADWRTNELNALNSFDYTTTVKAKEVKGYFNDYMDILPYALTLNYINYFPYRIYKGLAIPNESLQTNNLRFFPTNSYYDMRNDRGEIVALRGFNNGLYIQQKYSLSTTTISDKLDTNGTSTYLGNTELFDRLPEELLYNDNVGYIGSNSQFACMVYKDGFVTVDEEQGKIFIVSDKVSEISNQNMAIDFKKTLPLSDHYYKNDILGNKQKIDNPFVSMGYIVGYEDKYNRLLFTKRSYKPLPKLTTDGATFDGEFYKIGNAIVDFKNSLYFKNESITWSYALDSSTWVSEHDYFPNDYIVTNKGLSYIKTGFNGNSRIIKNSSSNVNPGNYDGEQFESYVDLVFNTRLDLIKQYQAIEWITECFDLENGHYLQFDTIDKIMVYHHHQCSGYIAINGNDLKVARNVEGKWQFNEFRDLLKTPETPFIAEDGSLIESSIINKAWFNKNTFSNNFLVVRVVFDNKTKVVKHLQNINVKSITSNR